MRESAFGGGDQVRLSRQATRADMKRLVILFTTVGLLVATLGRPTLATAMTNMPTTNTKLMPPNMLLDPYYGDPTHLYSHLHFWGQGTNVTVTSCSTVITKDGAAVSGYVTNITGLPVYIVGTEFSSAEFATSTSDPNNVADTATVTCFFNKGTRTSGKPTGSVTSSASFCGAAWSNCPPEGGVLVVMQ